jgi:hypothetical protein
MSRLTPQGKKKDKIEMNYQNSKIMKKNNESK